MRKSDATLLRYNIKTRLCRMPRDSYWISFIALSEQAECSERTLYRYINIGAEDKQKIPEKKLEMIATFFGVKPSELINQYE